MKFTNVHESYCGTIWGTDSKGKERLLCRQCKEAKAEFFLSQLSTYIDSEGWIDEWHMCKPCMRKWQNESK